MGIEEDEAARAAENTILRETDNGYRVLGAPKQSVTHQHDIDRIPEFNVTDELLKQSGTNSESWLMYGGCYEQHRYTTADIMIPETMTNSPELEYTISLSSGSSMQGSPLIVPSFRGGPPIMYQSNGPNHVKAIDAREGEILWSFTYAVPSDLILCCDDSSRGVAVRHDKVYMATLDSGIIALDRYTGEGVWYASTADHKLGYSATWAPIVYNGKVFTGSAGGEYGVRGFHTALDAQTGDEVWFTNTSPKREWVGDSIYQSSATNWTSPTIDSNRGYIYLPTGNPGPVHDGSVRPGPNRNSCGTLALDINTGERLWFHQESPHDLWDYDSSCPRVLIRDLHFPHRKETKDVIVNAGKTGWSYTTDAESGELVVRSEPGVQQINMYTMIPHIDEGRRLPFMPGAVGGNNWQPPTYNRETGLIYYKMNNSPSEAWWRFEEYEEGRKYWGGILEDETESIPYDYNGHISAIVAIDPTTGKRIWRDWVDSDLYLWGGMLSTATGLVFAGTQNGNLVCFDGETGDRLWEYDLGPTPVSGDPISWYDPGTEKQYIAVQIGGSGWLRRGQRDDRLAVFSMKS